MQEWNRLAQIELERMKQHITIEQLNELSDKAKEKLREWWEPKYGDVIYDPTEDCITCFTHPNYRSITKDNIVTRFELAENNCLPLLSVGQMIEFLTDNSFNPQSSVYFQDCGWFYLNKEIELCDALWEAVKYILEGDKKEEIELQPHINTTVVVNQDCGCFFNHEQRIGVRGRHCTVFHLNKDVNGDYSPSKGT